VLLLTFTSRVGKSDGFGGFECHLQKHITLLRHHDIALVRKPNLETVGAQRGDGCSRVNADLMKRARAFLLP
jgi:hypothetical protein